MARWNCSIAISERSLLALSHASRFQAHAEFAMVTRPFQMDRRAIEIASDRLMGQTSGKAHQATMESGCRGRQAARVLGGRERS
jgi:hypothetical protein